MKVILADRSELIMQRLIAALADHREIQVVSQPLNSAEGATPFQGPRLLTANDFTKGTNMPKSKKSKTTEVAVPPPTRPPWLKPFASPA